ncbi:BTAD domain-containing putative transcriptional regulator [Micromonospora polyrhachis]|uniref:DNA-binding SARP family transcriptional activator/tetratricopeptide (TPR) repeat protein n=1 Tax=Micromonospora polyrhachis TaxID=1282883 RepID=A0A7W7SKB7_9ACTN|nr:BTAD domain-containing putative transcriptional regulator [Micromonospora polyrhachis]MBB4956380.1 DNA-binding SARP family transcriptional activator/tetratricopeptide (TPR) repeat protein [Micromonospora polyrhachis]
MRFRVLGPLEIIRDGRLVPVGAPKQQTLLVLFLLRPNRVVTADWLIDALWDGRPPASAGMTLRSYVAGLRRAVEPHRSHRAPSQLLRGHLKGYEFRVDPDAIDANRFAHLVDTAAVALATGDAAAAEHGYATALALWRGEALAGAAELSAVRPEATRLTELRLSAEEGRFTAAVAAGRHASLLPDLHQFVAANPLREAARVQLMLALYRSGRQTEALAVFEEGRRIMAREYGLDSGAQARDLHRLILEQAVPPAPVPPAVVVPGPVVPAASDPARAAPPTMTTALPVGGAEQLVGRQVELALLENALTEASRRGGRVVAVVGEPGIGKTSLAAAISEQATADGVPVVWGHCPNVGQSPPFWLWRQVVRALAAMPQAGTTGSAASLDGFTTGPLHGLDGVADPDPVARFHAYEAVAELVRTVADRHGLLIVLDDLHAADPDSLLLLRFLATVLSSTRALVLATLRPYEHHPVLAATVAELARGPGFTQLRLAGLAAPSVADLVHRRTGVLPGERLVARLVTRTSGNPFFITELLRSGTDPGIGDLPPSIRDTVRLRLGELPEPARACLDLLGVADRQLDVNTMATVLEMTAEEITDGLVVAYTAELVIEAGPATTRFRHPLFAEVTYAELPPPRRAALHARLAMAYERAGDVAPAELAHHYGQALGLGHGADHLRWSLAAADDATRRFAYEDALSQLDRAALQLSPVSAGSPSSAQIELAVQLHRAALLQMTVGIGADAVDSVCSRARDLLALVGPKADIRPALWALGELAANRADYAICAELAERLVRAEDGETGPTVAAGEYLLGSVAYFAGNLAAADQWLTSAIDRLRAADPQLLGQQIGRRPALAAYNFRALVRSLRGDAAAARADIGDADQLAEELGDPYGRANAALYAAWMAMQEHDVATALAASRRCREIGEANGMPHFVATGTFFFEWATARSGDSARLPAMRAAAEGIYRPGLRATRTVTFSAMAEAYLAAGELTTAAVLADEALAVADRLGESVFTAELHRIRGIASNDPAELVLGARIAAEQGAGLLLARFTTPDGP